MRRLIAGMACVALAACSRAPDPSEVGESASRASSVAFAYHYDFRIPSDRIATAQETHAQACERLTSSRCRITGMTYRLDGSGQVSASLAVRVAAPLARAFGQQGVKGVQATGGTLTGAEITGTEAAPAIEAAKVSGADAESDRAAIDRELARRDLPPETRSDLLSRRTNLLQVQRDSGADAAAGQASLSFTPISFTYVAGSGQGLVARLSEAVQAGYLSLTWTLFLALTVLAYFGPPLLLMLLIALFWLRFGRRWWAAVFASQEVG